MAIALGGTATDGGNNGGAGTSHSFAVVVAAGESLRVMFAGDTALDDVVSVVWDPPGFNQALTLTVKRAPAGDRYLYDYFLLAPSAGNKNVVITIGAAHYILAGAVTYTGFALSGQPDATTTASHGVTDPHTTSLATVADNCWAFLLAGHNFSGAPETAGAGSTRRKWDATFGTWTFFDSNGPITPAGTLYSMTCTSGAGGNVTAMSTFSPNTGGSGPTVAQELPAFVQELSSQMVGLVYS